MKNLQEAINKMPLIPVLRGLTEADAQQVGECLIEAGLTILEVPIRSQSYDGFAQLDPKAMRALEMVVKNFGANVCITAGTVLFPADIQAIYDAGVTIGLSPSLNLAVIAKAVKLNVDFVSGIQTLSEAHAALRAGAKGIKPFPSMVTEEDGSETMLITPGAIKNMASFLPKGFPICPSGIKQSRVAEYMRAGAAAINIGSDIYRPGKSAAAIAESAGKYVTALRPFAKTTASPVP